MCFSQSRHVNKNAASKCCPFIAVATDARRTPRSIPLYWKCTWSRISRHGLRSAIPTPNRAKALDDAADGTVDWV